jgi:hypothetical protein
MIVVVVSASALIFGIANNSFSSWASGFSTLFGTSASQIDEKIVIEQVTFNLTGSGLGANIYVRNVGETDATVDSVYIANVTGGNNDLVKAIQIQSPSSLDPGSFEIVSATFVPNAGSTYSFTLATSLGNTVTAVDKA